MSKEPDQHPRGSNTPSPARPRSSAPSADEEFLRESLTQYDAYTLRKAENASDGSSKSTWARAEVTREHRYQDSIKGDIKKLDKSDTENGESLQTKINALFKFQRGQVDALVDDLSSREQDSNFVWSVAQLDRKEIIFGPHLRQTETITVYVKRCPSRNVDQRALYAALNKHDREKPSTALVRVSSDPSSIPLIGRRASLQISDVRPIQEIEKSKPSTEEECRQALTTYCAFAVSAAVAKGSLSFALTNFRIDQKVPLTRGQIKRTLRDISIRTRYLFSLDYRRKPLDPVEQLLVLSFLNQQSRNEKDENFEWQIIKAFKYHHQDHDTKRPEVDSGSEKVSVQIYTRRVLKPDRSAIEVMHKSEQLEQEIFWRKRQISLPLMILPNQSDSTTLDTTITVSPGSLLLTQPPIHVSMDELMSRELPVISINDPTQDQSSTNDMARLPMEMGPLVRVPARRRVPPPDGSSQAGDSWWNWIHNASTNTAAQQRVGKRRPPREPSAWSAWGAPRQPPPPDITSIECWMYDNGEPPENKTSPIMDYWILDWAESPAPRRDDREPKAGLKLLHRRIAHDEQPFSEATLPGLNRLLSVPPIFQHRMSSKSGFLAKLSKAPDKIVFVCKKAASSATITAVLSYSASTNITTGYILSRDGIESIQPLIYSFSEEYAACPHPLLIMVLVLEIMVDNISSNLQSVEDNLRQVEQATGYSNQAHIGSSSTTPDDYRELAKSLGAQTCRFVLIQSLIQNASLLRGFIEEQLTCPAYVSSPDNAHLTQTLLERSNVTKSTLLHMQTYGAIEGRLGAQQNVLFNLIAQQDNSLNIEIAKDSKEIAASSKRDSSAMKVIAVLTTLFLPGAFIATLLSMPLLSWNTGPIITSHFWIYWAITIPLTLVTIATISIWIHIQGKLNEAASKAARETVDRDTSSSETSSSFWDRERKPSLWSTTRWRWQLWWSEFRRKRIFRGVLGDSSSGSGSGSSRSLVDD